MSGVLSFGRGPRLDVRYERSIQTVNGVPAKGGSMDGPGPVIAADMLYVTSGVGGLVGRPGNELLAFGIEQAGLKTRLYKGRDSKTEIRRAPHVVFVAVRLQTHRGGQAGLKTRLYKGRDSKTEIRRATSSL